MTRRINIYEARARLSQLIREIEKNGNTVAICRNGKPVADLIRHQKKVNPLIQDPALKGARFMGDPCAPVSGEDWNGEFFQALTLDLSLGYRVKLFMKTIITALVMFILPAAAVTAGDALSTEDRSARIILYCRSGRRAGIAQKTLEDLGFTNVVNFGGINRWQGERVVRD